MYFTQKIILICNSLQAIPLDQRITNKYHHDSVCELSVLRPVTSNEVKNIIKRSPKKSCSLDPMPTWMLKECVDILLPNITNTINLSILSGNVPSELKYAHVRPLLKKQGLDQEDLKNYRPVSNLSFLSKVLEKVVHVAARLEEY